MQTVATVDEYSTREEIIEALHHAKRTACTFDDRVDGVSNGWHERSHQWINHLLDLLDKVPA